MPRTRRLHPPTRPGQGGRQGLERWRWREGDGAGQNWGEKVSWRIGKGAELKELIAAKDRLTKARL